MNSLIEKNNRCYCFEDLNSKQSEVIIPCCHIFHSECAKELFKYKYSCPICRSKISYKIIYYFH